MTFTTTKTSVVAGVILMSMLPMQGQTLMLQPTAPASTIAVESSSVAAPASTSAPVSAATPADSVFQAPLTAVDAAQFPRMAARAESTWGNWEEITSANYNINDFYNAVTNVNNTGGTWPEIKPFKVYRRDNTQDPMAAQYKFAGVFNDVDIIFDYDRNTQLISAQEQSTGIASTDALKQMVTDGYPGYTPYDILTFFMAPTIFYEGSSWLDFVNSRGAYIFVTSNLGYQSWPSFAFDNRRDMRIQLTDAYAYIPSGKSTTTANLNLPEGVTGYRMAYFTERESAGGDWTTVGKPSYMSLISTTPETSPVAYTVGTSPSLELTSDAVVRHVAFFPLDEKGTVVDKPTYVHIYRNITPAGEWLPLGKGKLIEHYWTQGGDSDKIYADLVDLTTYSYTAAPAEQEIDIEYLSSNPAVYRIKNPFSAAHPYADYLLEGVSTSEDFYLVFDATDPSKVLIPESLSGMTERIYGEPHIAMDRLLYSRLEAVDPETVEESPDFSYGKFTDGKITFQYSGLRFYATFRGLETTMLELQLPGYEEYSMNITYPGSIFPNVTVNDQGATTSVSEVTANVAKIEFALFSTKEYDYYSQIRPFPEKFGAMIADRAEGVKVYSAQPDAEGKATLSVPIEDVPYGYSYLVAVLVDAQGNYHTSYLFDVKVYNPAPLDQWESVGTTYATNVFLPYNLTQRFTYEVDIRRNPDNEYIYCLYEPFKAEYEYLKPLVSNTITYDDSKPRAIYFFHGNGNSISLSDEAGAISGFQNSEPYHTGLGVEGYGELTLKQPWNSPGRIFLNDDGFYEIDLANSLTFNLPGFGIDGDFYYYGMLSFVLDYSADRDLSLPVNWPKVADVEVEENMINHIFSSESTVIRETELRESPKSSGVYALLDPFIPTGELADGLVHDGSVNHIFINAADPDFVYFCGEDGVVTSEFIHTTGYSHSSFGDFYMFYMANGIVAGAVNSSTVLNPDDYVGTAEFASDNTLQSINMDGTLYPCDGNNIFTSWPSVFRVNVKRSGVDEIESDLPAEAETDAPVEYFNLQGVRVANPSGGIFIRRQGNSVTKVAIP